MAAEAARTAKPRSRGGRSAGKRSSGRIDVADVSVSSPERVIDSQSGLHKIDLARFYCRVADWILPGLDNRPVSLLRAPEGIEGEQFFQKHAGRLAIPDIKHLDQSLDPAHPPLMEIDTQKALVGAVQMGAVEFHTWGATTDRIERPDHLVFDLDPDPELPWQRMLDATAFVLDILDKLQLDAFLKTSGGKGMHIVLPLGRFHGWDHAKAFARAVSEFACARQPDRLTATMGPKNRVGKIFIDYLRNQRGASTVAAYSVRARPGLPVSVPIRRDELGALKAASQWTVDNLGERLDALSSDPWSGYANRQRITASMWRTIGAKPPDDD